MTIADLWSGLRRAIERGGVNDDVIASVCAAHGLRVESAMEDIGEAIQDGLDAESCWHCPWVSPAAAPTPTPDKAP